MPRTGPEGTEYLGVTGVCPLDNRGPNRHRRGSRRQDYGATDPGPLDGEPGRSGMVMLEAGPGPLGLCPVRGIAEINQET